MLVLLSLFACSPETGLGHDKAVVVPPATPPGNLVGDFGNPPDWNDCFEGLRGMYFNLENTHPDVEPDVDDKAPTCCRQDWWDQDKLYVDQFDASLDHGTNWFPVDDGLADDPLYFAVRWIGWIRVWSDGPVTFSLGADSDAWIIFDDDTVLAAMPATYEYDPQEITVDLEATQAHFDVRFAQRKGTQDGFSFRVMEGDVSICYPDYSEE
jgi:hypothetical protein